MRGERGRLSTRQVMKNCKLSGVSILELSFGFNFQPGFSAHVCDLHFSAISALSIRKVPSKHRLAV
jgi:hypothetical protein